MPQEPHKDQKYIKALLRNDTLLIKEIYDKWHKNVLSFVIKNSGNKQDADDVFQETLTALLIKARRGNFILTVPLGGLLFFIYRACWIDILRKKGIEKAAVKELKLYLDDKESMKIAEEVTADYRRKKLFDFSFEKLSDKCKKLLKMSFSKIPAKEIMAELNIASENAVYQSVSRCKVNLIGLTRRYKTKFIY